MYIYILPRRNVYVFFFCLKMLVRKHINYFELACRFGWGGEKFLLLTPSNWWCWFKHKWNEYSVETDHLKCSSLNCMKCRWPWRMWSQQNHDIGWSHPLAILNVKKNNVVPTAKSASTSRLVPHCGRKVFLLFYYQFSFYGGSRASLWREYFLFRAGC